MTKWLKIEDDSVYTGLVPTQVELPVHKKEPIPHSISVTSKYGDPDWEQQLERWMYLSGYYKGTV